ncbi:MAG: hypothetical protein J6Y07_02890 [Alphaproteobacteria bacterium]|nr:hypothetical protein [Alphaproteobacteria bacterium]
MQYSISKTFDWYLTHVLPTVEKYAIQKKDGYHGLYTHTAAVVFRGIDYALALGQDTAGVVLACAFHDMARTNDEYDIIHGKNAIPLAESAMNEIGNVSYDLRESIIYAVKNHSLNLPAPDYISECLWDADRTRLAWECGYNPKFFATNRAKIIASKTAKEYIDFMKGHLSEYALKIIQLGESY